MFHLTSFLVIIFFLQEDEFSLTKEQETWVVDIMLSVTLVKLLLMVYCRSFTNEIVKAYAQDHFFDVITNIIGLVAALLANYIKYWIDPVGAIIVSNDLSIHSILTSICLSISVTVAISYQGYMVLL